MTPENAYEIHLLQRRLEFLHLTDPISHRKQIYLINGWLDSVNEQYSEINTRDKLMTNLTAIEAQDQLHHAKE